MDELGKQIVDISGRLAGATCRWLLLMAQFDARKGYLSFGLASTAQWLSHACGIAHRTAVDHVRVARSLQEFPRLADEMGAVRLSYSQVRAISRIAGSGEHGLVDDLIEAARHATVAQLEVVVRGLRTVDHNDNATDPGEYLKQSWTSDSRWRLSARLDPERGALFGAAIEAIMQRDGCSAADAFARLAEIGLASLADAQNPPRALRGDEHAAVVIHLDAARLPARDESVSRSAERGAEDPQDPRSAQPDADGQPPRSAQPDADGQPPRSAERDAQQVSTATRPYARVAGGPGLPDRVVQRLLCEGRVGG